MSTTTLPIPRHFDPANAEVWGYTPSAAALFEAAQDWTLQYQIQPATLDTVRIVLCLIDGQNDFTHPQGTLYVGGRSGKGAVEDCVRTAEFIYRNAGFITHITPTLDTHVPLQIFFPSFWVDADGKHPAAHTVITTADVIAGRYAPDPAAAFLAGGNYPWLLKYVQHYCAQLEAAGKYTLYLWPFHCQLGSVGYALSGVLEEAVKFHAFARATQVVPEIKGNSPFTENYSVLGPEVETAHDGKAIGQKNTRFIDTLLGADHVVFMGQAASHCVKSSIDDFLDQIMAKDPSLTSKVYVVRDCMSAVAVPDGAGGFVADFTPEAEAALKRFEQAGMHVVNSTTPLPDWPDIKVA
jgi:nicotinamidase-related amidase